MINPQLVPLHMHINTYYYLGTLVIINNSYLVTHALENRHIRRVLLQCNLSAKFAYVSSGQEQKLLRKHKLRHSLKRIEIREEYDDT